MKRCDRCGVVLRENKHRKSNRGRKAKYCESCRAILQEPHKEYHRALRKTNEKTRDLLEDSLENEQD